VPAFDLHCPLGSLPLACKTGLAGVPADIPYLRAPDDRVGKWRARLQDLRGPRVALAWSGRATHVNDRNRSLPFAQLDALLSLAPSDVSFVSMQRELRPADADLLSRDSRILHLGGELGDFAETAALLSAVDHVVCVDTSVAHVAGALGRPAIVMLPFQPDWRWTLDRERSPWYPALKLVRQPAPGDWASVVGRVRDELSAVSR
jgi:hypothetical protein